MKACFLFLGLLFPMQSLFAAAEQVYRFEDAQFLYCHTQSFGSVVDLRQVDLTKEGDYEILIGTKSCKKNSTINWEGGPAIATITHVMDTRYKILTPQLVVKNIQDITDMVEVSTSGYYHGLAALWVGGPFDGRWIYGNPASGTIRHNSGECFFIKTLETDGLPFTRRCD